MWYLLYAKAKKEFEARDEIEALGIEVLCAKRLLKKRVGRTQRDVVFFDAPVLANFLFANIAASEYLAVMAIKPLASTTYVVSDADMRDVRRFMDHKQAIYEAEEKQKHNLDAIAEYYEGQPLKVVGDRFSDIDLTFKGMVDRKHDPFPKVQMVGEMMGREVTVEADPLEVRAAE